MNAPFVREFPFSINDPKCDVLIRRSGAEVEEYSLVVTRFLDNFVRRCFGFIDEVRVEYVELKQM